MGGGDHLDTKIERLALGDIIVIRNGSKERLEFLGYCAVAGPLYDQEEGSPWNDLLWRDEVDARRVIYQHRCAVDFESLPQLSLSQLRWEDLDSLGFLNVRGNPILGAQAWGQKLSGNFIEDAKELAAFNKLVQFEPFEGEQA
ncbi:MAG: hypothetical protein WCA63_05780 [Gallionella sp.]